MSTFQELFPAEHPIEAETNITNNPALAIVRAICALADEVRALRMLAVEEMNP